MRCFIIPFPLCINGPAQPPVQMSISYLVYIIYLFIHCYFMTTLLTKGFHVTFINITTYHPSLSLKWKRILVLKSPHDAITLSHYRYKWDFFLNSREKFEPGQGFETQFSRSLAWRSTTWAILVLLTVQVQTSLLKAMLWKASCSVTLSSFEWDVMRSLNLNSNNLPTSFSSL